jgi:dienelactone hydrolase
VVSRGEIIRLGVETKTLKILSFRARRSRAEKSALLDTNNPNQSSSSRDLKKGLFHVKHSYLPAILLLLLALTANATPNTPEKVSFPSFDDPTTLTGYLFQPSNASTKTPAPAVVLLHGCSGMLDSKGQIRTGIAHWAQRFVEKGWVVLSVDSFNPRGHREICTLKERPIREGRERPRDAYGALKYLQSLSFVARDRVALMGFSHGATGTLYAINRQDALWKLADKQGLRYQAALSFYPGCTSANKNGLKPAIPLAIFIGAADDWTPAAPCEALIANARTARHDARIHLYPGAYHSFDVPGTTVRVRKDVRNRRNPELVKGVHVGGNDEARKAAEKDVEGFLVQFLVGVAK